MLDTSSRLLRLLTLLQARRDWPGGELAERLEVTPRTLRRDVQRLRDLGYPVHSVPGVAGGYRLGAGRALPPLLLDDDEAIAVVVSLRSAASNAVLGLAEASVRALAKLDQVLPARLRDRIAALAESTVPMTSPGPTIRLDLLTALAAACRGCQRLTFGYRDRDGSASARSVEPYRLVAAGYRWYLLAYDLLRRDWRTFRVDRIGDLTATGPGFAPREHPDPAAFVARAVTTEPYRYRARVLVHAAEKQMAERMPPTVGVLSPAGPGQCMLTSGSDSLDALAFHLAMLGVDFTVLEPPELSERVGLLAERLRRAAAGTADSAGTAGDNTADSAGTAGSPASS
ncbi:MAG: helix-turn-helix transcriptional regulator [Streptosporangiaceae bacterium]